MPVRKLRSLKSSPIRDLLAQAMQPGMISLAGGLPCPSLFDTEGLSQALTKAMQRPDLAMQYGQTEGEPLLRQTIASLMLSRNARLTPAQVLVTSGSQQALDLVARLVVEPDDLVVVERPAYLAALSAFRLQTNHIKAVACDDEGPVPAALEAITDAGMKPRLIYLVPNFANPSGNTMSLQRRRAILFWAVTHRVIVVEDDPYGELRFEGEPLPSLLALAQTHEHQITGANDWVIHLSTLSKIVAPGLRIGWAILPETLMAAAVRLKQSMDLQTSTLMQLAGMHYLASGRLRTHIPVLQAQYRLRKDALRQSLVQHFGDRLSLNDPAGGMFLWARINEPSLITAGDWLSHALKAGVAFVPGETFYAESPETNTLRLSFATTAVRQMPVAARRLRQSFDTACQAAAKQP